MVLAVNAAIKIANALFFIINSSRIFKIIEFCYELLLIAIYFSVTFNLFLCIPGKYLMVI